ncbi:hypothetical protein TrRE_jg13525, partial [Triparma retinervis]
MAEYYATTTPSTPLPPLPFTSRRSPLYLPSFASSTSQPLATSHSSRILSLNGNAVAASITAAAVLAVTEPCSTGVGGDAFAMVYQSTEAGRPLPTPKIQGISGAGRTSSSAPPLSEVLSSCGYDPVSMKWSSPFHALSVTVPGAVRMTLHEIPPPGQGVAGLIALSSYASMVSLHGPPSSPACLLHYQIEAVRMGFEDARARVGDTADKEGDLEYLLDPQRIHRRVSETFDPSRTAFKGSPMPTNCTVSFQTADSMGNAVSFVNSNYMGFGTGLVPEGLGFALQNRGAGLSLHQLQFLLALAVLRLARSYSVVVIGGGWAGYSASSTLASSADVKVTVLEASPRNSGGGLAGGWRTASGRPVEAGIHGFWREYRNTFRVMRDEIGLDLDDVLSDFTPSVLFSKNGRVATAPVLATSARKGSKSSKSSNPILESIYGSLPPPLDTALLADFDEKRLNLQDRISAVGLLSGWADFGQSDPASWGRYDKISAAEFFLDYGGVTPSLYAELVSPMLHVLPMGPGSDISAAAALSCFHVFALQTRGAFDVRWAKGSLSDLIFDPWRVKLEEKGVRVEGGKRVNGIERAEDGDGMVVTAEDGSEYTADAVILAVGGTSAAKLKEGSKALKEAAGARRVENLRGVTCVATRIWLEPAPSPTTGLGGGAYSSTTLPKAVA